MDHSGSTEERCMLSSHSDDRMGEMDQEDLLSGRDSPLKPPEGMEVPAEDFLAKLRQQVSAASILERHTGASSPSKSPNAYFNHIQNNNILSQNHVLDRINTLLHGKLMKREAADIDMSEGSREMALRAEALQRQRETLLTSPHSIMNAMRGGPPSLVPPPTSHIPYLPPTSQMPPTPGSAGSSSSGNGNRTPSHTPEPNHNQQPWSFEEQFKQVRHEDYDLSDRADSPRVREPAKHSSFEDDKRKLYELSPESKRKDFLDELFSFMQKRGTPINRLPIMAKQVLDLYELYNLVVERGGLVDVINKKLWQEIIKGLKLPSSITSAAFTLRTQYMKYLYPFECEKRSLSSPAELQCAIDGNRREGRRSSYGTYGDMMQPPMLPLQNLQNFQNFQNLHNPLGLRPQLNGNGGPHSLLPQDLLLGRGGSPPGSQEALLEATRLTMWKLYNHGLTNGLGGEEEAPKPLHPHMPVGLGPVPPQKEALNLDVKDDGDPWIPRSLSQSKDNGEMRHRDKEDLGNRPPSVKRPATVEDPEDPHSPTRANGSSSLSLPGANIKIASRGEGNSNDQSLVVNMEINGISYQGVLFAQVQRATRLGHG